MHLATVTLVCVDCVNGPAAEAAIAASLKGCSFARVLWLTSIETESPHAVKIEPLTTLRQYSEFIVRELWKYIDTSHCLIIQHDGWVCNPSAWRPEWQEFDYIGGNVHWTGPGPAGVGGNGGFSLRSRRLLKAASGYVRPLYGCHPEDVFFSSPKNGRRAFGRERMEADGFRFAKRQDQQTFCKNSAVWGGEFGHHKGDLGRFAASPDEWPISEYVYQYQYTHLGDQWGMVSWLLKESVRAKTVMRVARSVAGVDYSQRLTEITDLLDSSGRIQLVDDATTRWIESPDTRAAEPYLPTKVRWEPGGEGVCYQFDGMRAERGKNPPHSEMNTLGLWCEQHAGIRLGRGMSLEMCVEIAAFSSLFLGVCSGMSHLCHSVGVPVFLIEYKRPVACFHLGKDYTRCRGTIDALAKADAFLMQP